MKTFFVLALIVATVNSSFLRELNTTPTESKAVSVSAVEFKETCSTGDVVTITATTEKTAGFNTATFKGILSSGIEENDITLPSSSEHTSNPAKIVWTLTPTTSKAGVYKLKSITDNTTPAGFTFTIPDTVTSTLTIAVAVTHDATQEGTQEIKEGKTFDVKFSADLTAVPLIYSASTAKTPIADCSIDESDAKKVLCKPTGDEMEKDTEYTIHYKSGCDETLVATKVKVKFTPKDGSVFLTFGKFALFAIAFLF